MEKGKEWLDLKLCDWGKSQLFDKDELKKARDTMKSFYITVLLPLYVPVQNSRNWHFSVPNSELTCRIFFEDIVKYHQKKNGVKDMYDLLKQVGKYNATMTDEKIARIIYLMEEKKNKDRGRIR